MTIEQERLLRRVDEKLTVLIQEMKKETWIRVQGVQELTGWTGRQLESKRRSNIIQFRRTKNGLEYLLESIPEIFIKNKILLI